MATGATQPLPESWVDIPIDYNVLNLARFAVDEYNKEQPADLEFRGVWSAKWWILVGATHYWIVLDAADGGVINKYEAKVVVAMTPTLPKELEEFKPLLQA